MDDREFEHMLERLAKYDFAAGTEAFRDALLARCLAVLDADDEGIVLDDSDLDMLAAAGDLSANGATPFELNRSISDNKHKYV